MPDLLLESALAQQMNRALAAGYDPQATGERFTGLIRHARGNSALREEAENALRNGTSADDVIEKFYQQTLGGRKIPGMPSDVSQVANANVPTALNATNATGDMMADYLAGKRGVRGAITGIGSALNTMGQDFKTSLTPALGTRRGGTGASEGKYGGSPGPLLTPQEENAPITAQTNPDAPTQEEQTQAGIRSLGTMGSMAAGMFAPEFAALQPVAGELIIPAMLRGAGRVAAQSMVAGSTNALVRGAQQIAENGGIQQPNANVWESAKEGFKQAAYPTTAFGAGLGVASRIPAIARVAKEALTDPFANVRADMPDIANALTQHVAQSPEYAGRLGASLSRFVVKPLTTVQRALFGKALVLDNLEAEIARKPDINPATIKEAQQLRSELPDNLASQPWFVDAIERHKAFVEPTGAQAATTAGVNSASFRNPQFGYVRLVPQRLIDEAKTARLESIKARQGAAIVTPNTGITETVFGQPNALLPSNRPLSLSPEMQGVAPGTLGLGPTNRAAITGSAKRVTGTTGYATDYETLVKADLADKLSKAAKNNVFSAIAKEAQSGNGLIQEIATDVPVANGKAALYFNDRFDVIQPPAVGQNIKDIRKFEVPQSVADAVALTQAKQIPRSAIGNAWNQLSNRITGLTLANPAVAGLHANTLASSVGTGIPAVSAIEEAASALPVVKSANTLKRMATVDFTDPAEIARYTRLSQNGGLRLPAQQDANGLIDLGHNWLFGQTGMDARARMVASKDFEQQAAERLGINPDNPMYANLESQYVNAHAGNYVQGNQGRVQQFLQETGIAPFVAINTAKLRTSLGAVVGSDAIPGVTLGSRARVMARGPVGAATALAGASWALSGHSPSENAAGHESDVATGMYRIPGTDSTDAQYVYKPGSPSDVLKSMPKGSIELYIKKGFLDPASATAIRLLEPLATAQQGNAASGLLRSAFNTVTGLMGPAVTAGWGMATGKTLQMGADNQLMSHEPPTLVRDNALASRAYEGIRQANQVASLLPSEQQSPVGWPMSIAMSAGNPLNQMSGPINRANQYVSDVVRQMYGMPNMTDRIKLLETAKTELETLGIRDPQLLKQLQQATVKASRDTRTRTEAKYNAFYKQP